MGVNGEMAALSRYQMLRQVAFGNTATPHVKWGGCKTGRLLTCWEAASERLSGLRLNASVLKRVVIPQCLAVIRLDLVC